MSGRNKKFQGKAKRQKRKASNKPNSSRQKLLAQRRAKKRTIDLRDQAKARRASFTAPKTASVSS